VLEPTWQIFADCVGYADTGIMVDQARHGLWLKTISNTESRCQHCFSEFISDVKKLGRGMCDLF